MLRRTNSPHRLLTSSALVIGLSLGSMPATVFAAAPAPPSLPADQPTAAPAPQPAEQPVPIQAAPAPAPQPVPQPAAGAGWEDPTAAPPVQPQPQAQPMPQPAPIQPMPQPQPLPPPGPNPNKGLGMTIAGFTIFGVSYISSAFGGVLAIDSGAPEVGRPMLYPVVGPFIAAGKTSGSATAAFGLAFVGLIQLTGVSLGVSGAVILSRSRRAARAHAPRMSAAPGGLQLQF